MNPILQLMQQRAALHDKATAILNTVTTEQRAATAEELATVEECRVSMEALARTIAAHQQMEAMCPDPVAGGSARREPGQVHNNAEDAPWGMPAVPGETKGQRSARLNHAFGEFLLATRTAAMSPSGIDPRLQKRAASGANEKVGSEGGFLVDKEVGAEILEEMNEVGVLAPKCTPVPIGSNANAITIKGVDETSRVNGSRWGGVQAYWADEAASVTASKPKFRLIDLKLKKLFAVYYATDELIQDAAALGALANKAFGEEMAFKVDDAIVNGPGAGQPLGILNAGCLVSVAKETGQAASTFVWENATKMYARCNARSRAKSAWYVNQDVEPQFLTMSQAVGTGGAPVYLPAGGASAAPFATLLGRPIIPIEFCATLGTVGDVILGDFSQYLLATKGGLQQAESMHVQFLTDEMTFRFIYRADGQPVRSAPMTPFKGTNTLSSFVALNTRA